MKKGIKIVGGIIVTAIVIYLFGPKVSPPELSTTLPNVPSNLLKIEQYILEDSIRSNTKLGNASRLIWANDSLKQKTEYVLVYLHGFSASPEEGAPIHAAFAKRYGMNLYIPRLYDHGLKSDNPLHNFTGEGFINSAKEAIAIGQQLGEKVIIMACSTGATAALYIASGNPDIYGLFLYSPNIDLYDKTSDLIIKPWGTQILKAVVGSDTYHWDADSIREQYWYTDYDVKSIAVMKAMLQATMKPAVFEKVNQPIFLGYYYKNEDEQDHAVSVEKMKVMFEEISTPKTMKREIAFPDAGVHPIQSKYSSKDYKSVMEESYRFAEEVLLLVPVTAK